jgi:hypothetical protein
MQTAAAKIVARAAASRQVNCGRNDELASHKTHSSGLVPRCQHPGASDPQKLSSHIKTGIFGQPDPKVHLGYYSYEGRVVNPTSDR